MIAKMLSRPPRPKTNFFLPCLLAISAVIIASLATPSCARKPGPKRNVILISIDTLRADHVGCYGYTQPTTPRLDGLAEQGVRFQNAYATSPWTLPSHVSMFTGLYADVHGMQTAQSELNNKARTLAAILKKHGLRTGAVVCAAVLDRHYNLDLGFDVYDTELIYPKVRRPKRVKVADDITDKALAYIDKTTNKEFFLFLHYWDVHHPYNPAKKYVDIFDPDYTGRTHGNNIRYRKDMVKGMNPRNLQHIIALYDGEIRYTDDAIGRLLEGLAARQLMENTMIIVTSDHGEEFLEHGGRAHLCTCWEEVLRIPLIFYVPWIERHAPATDTPVSLVDLFPTILDLMGIESQNYDSQGRSLQRLMRDGVPLERPLLFAETLQGHFDPDYRDPAGIWSVLIAPERWKFHLFLRPNEEIQFLFDLSADPGEQNNQLDLHRETGEKLVSQLKKQQKIHGGMRRDLNLSRHKELTKELEQKLKSLGYI